MTTPAVRSETVTADPTHDRAGPSSRAGLLQRPVSRLPRAGTPEQRLRGRPGLYTAYRQDMALLNTPAKRRAVIALVVAAMVAAFVLPADWLTLLAISFPVAIGAIGLNLVTGYAGQVSLGHAFFVGVGAFTAAAIGTVSDDPDLISLGITQLPVWLLAAGLMAALMGLLVAPLALRLRGLYLAIVTLGLVFIGEYVFNQWTALTGGAGVGRAAAPPQMFGFNFDATGEVLGVVVTANQRQYLLMLVLLVLFAVLARNLVRSDLGRAFAAVRDRDIAAEVIGVDLTRAKILAFVISSFYAGVAGALYYSVLGVIEPGSFDLLLSIQYIAMILIGGAATISGSIMGALFLQTLGRFSREIVGLLDFLPDALVFSPELMQSILAGLLLIVFLIVEPRGLYGIWVRIRNYWKGWPFSY